MVLTNLTDKWAQDKINTAYMALENCIATTKTKRGLYVLNQEKTDTTKDGDKVVTTDVTVVDVGPEATKEIKVGQHVGLNYYELQLLPEKDGHIYGVIKDEEIKVVY